MLHIGEDGAFRHLLEKWFALGARPGDLRGQQLVLAESGQRPGRDQDLRRDNQRVRSPIVIRNAGSALMVRE